MMVHRLGPAATRAQARQFISRSHVKMGERVVD
jgi:ribosomal protein S4